MAGACGGVGVSARLELVKEEERSEYLRLGRSTRAPRRASFPTLSKVTIQDKMSLCMPR